MVPLAYVGHVTGQIAAQGYAVLRQPAVAPQLPSFYTVGRTANALPELLAYGFTRPAADRVFAAVAQHEQAGHSFAHGDVVEGLLGAVPLAFMAIPLGYPTRVASSLYDPFDVRYTQIVSPDAQGRFPWEPGSQLAHHPRPYLDAPAPQSYRLDENPQR